MLLHNAHSAPGFPQEFLGSVRIAPTQRARAANLAPVIQIGTLAGKKEMIEMAARSSHDVTQLLKKWSKGDQDALDQLMPLVYDELRRLAGAYLRREDRIQTLQPTALVHQLFLKLIDQRRVDWQNRAHFFGIAAKLMRRIIVDEVRAHIADKRGGGRGNVSLSKARGIGEKPNLDILAVHEALERLARIDADQERIVELRFFGGLTIEETAEVAKLSHATVEREWKIAKAWLKRELSRPRAS